MVAPGHRAGAALLPKRGPVLRQTSVGGVDACQGSGLAAIVGRHMKDSQGQNRADESSLSGIVGGARRNVANTGAGLRPRGKPPESSP